MKVFALVLALFGVSWFTPRHTTEAPISKRSSAADVESRFSFGGTEKGMDYSKAYPIPGAQSFEYRGKGWTIALTLSRPGVSRAPLGRRWVP